MRRGVRELAIAIALAGPAAAAADDLVGQIVCSQCWFEADRRAVPYGTADDLECAAECAAAGVPPALAVRDGETFELVRLAGRPGDAGSNWLEVVGRFARVSGELRERKDRRVLRVSRVELLEASPWGPAKPAETVDAGQTRLAWTDVRGREVGLDDYRGRIVVLNFWATWCAPCRKEMPDLARIQRDYGMYGVHVIGAAADAPAQREHVLAHARRWGVNFPVWLGATTEQMRALGLGVALPATVVIDADGRVVERTDGLVERRALAARLDGLLAAGSAAHARAEADHEHDHAAPPLPADAAPPARTGAGRRARAKTPAHAHSHAPSQASLVPS